MTTTSPPSLGSLFFSHSKTFEMMIFKVLVNNSDNNKSSRCMLTNLFSFLLGHKISQNSILCHRRHRCPWGNLVTKRFQNTFFSSQRGVLYITVLYRVVCYVHLQDVECSSSQFSYRKGFKLLRQDGFNTGQTFRNGSVVWTFFF